MRFLGQTGTLKRRSRAGNGSWVMGHRSMGEWVMGHESLGHGSRVTGHGSWVMGHGSMGHGHKSMD